MGLYSKSDKTTGNGFELKEGRSRLDFSRNYGPDEVLGESRAQKDQWAFQTHRWDFFSDKDHVGE